jgi:hypothetical protein
VDRKEMIHKARLGIHVGDNTRELPFDLPLHDSKLLREWNYKRLHDQEHGSSLLFLHLESYKIFDLVVSDFYILPFGRPLEEDEYYFITNGNLLNQGLLTGRSL